MPEFKEDNAILASAQLEAQYSIEIHQKTNLSPPGTRARLENHSEIMFVVPGVRDRPIVRHMSPNRSPSRSLGGAP